MYFLAAIALLLAPGWVSASRKAVRLMDHAIFKVDALTPGVGVRVDAKSRVNCMLGICLVHRRRAALA